MGSGNGEYTGAGNKGHHWLGAGRAGLGCPTRAGGVISITRQRSGSNVVGLKVRLKSAIKMHNNNSPPPKGEAWEHWQWAPGQCLGLVPCPPRWELFPPTVPSMGNNGVGHCLQAPHWHPVSTWGQLGSLPQIRYTNKGTKGKGAGGRNPPIHPWEGE